MRKNEVKRIRRTLLKKGWKVHFGPCDETGKNAAAGVGVMWREDYVKIFPEKIKDEDLGQKREKLEEWKIPYGRRLGKKLQGISHIWRIWRIKGSCGNNGSNSASGNQGNGIRHRHADDDSGRFQQRPKHPPNHKRSEKGGAVGRLGRGGQLVGKDTERAHMPQQRRRNKNPG